MLIFCFFFSFSLSAKNQPTNKKQNKNKSCKTERLYVNVKKKILKIEEYGVFFFLEYTNTT